MLTLENSKTHTLVYPVIVLSLAAFFLFYKYVLQVFPSIITQPLMQEFYLSGSGLGSLVATFYYSYILVQLFVGILLDKYSIRRLTSGAIFCSALGLILFSKAETLLLASLARIMMGAAVAFATVTYMKLAADWFPPQQYAFVSGLLATAAMAGAVFGQAPLAWFITQFGWRSSLLGLGLLGLAFALLFYSIVRDVPRRLQQQPSSTISLKAVYDVLRNRQNWLLSFYSGLAFSPVAIFGGLWGNPFLEQAYLLSKTQAASLISLVFVGLGLGAPLLGLLAEQLKKRRVVMLFSTLISTLALILILNFQQLPLPFLAFLLFLFGFGLGSFMLVFAIAKDLNPYLTATVIAMINTSDALFDALTEPLIGKILDLGSKRIVGGVRQFSHDNYRLALIILPLYLLVGVFLLFWLKEPSKINR
ncbi:MAG: MFS transporter [Tatlockia sp.]|nr:MFS transporter [Tatlockia sp.]